MMTGEMSTMTDAEVADQIERADRFIEQLRDAITATVVDPANWRADAQRRGLQHIAATPDAVPFVTMCNLANFNAAMRGELLDLIEVGLLAALLSTMPTRRRSSPGRDRDREGAQTAAAMMDGPH